MGHDRTGSDRIRASLGRFVAGANTPLGLAHEEMMMELLAWIERLQLHHKKEDWMVDGLP